MYTEKTIRVNFRRNGGKIYIYILTERASFRMDNISNQFENTLEFIAHSKPLEVSLIRLSRFHFSTESGCSSF